MHLSSAVTAKRPTFLRSKNNPFDSTTINLLIADVSTFGWHKYKMSEGTNINLLIAKYQPFVGTNIKRLRAQISIF